MEYLISISFAALVGGLVGLEREYRDKSAGFRTMILIAVGSCLFTILSGIIGQNFGGDGARIAAAVVSGVGFLGAGVIIQKGITIHGLTTAASIWLVASLGMGMGAGEYVLVLMVTAGILFVLWILPLFERKIDALHEFLEFTLIIKNTDKAEKIVLALFDEAQVRVLRVRRTQPTKGERCLKVLCKTRPSHHDTLAKLLISERSVLTFNDD